MNWIKGEPIMEIVRRQNRESVGRNRARQGFTLVELLVVIAIMVALAALTLAFMPRQDSRLAGRGADQLQTYLASARSRALRDQAPRGVRFIPTNGNFTSVQLIETPEPLAPVGASINFPTIGGTNATISGLTPSVAATIQPGGGDMLEITYGVGSIHRITSFNSATGALTLASTPPCIAIQGLTLTSNFRIIRQTQPLMGEPALQLPNTVFVGSNSQGSQNIPTSWNTAYTEIVFAPSGQVINATAGRIVLYLTDFNSISKPALLTVYATTGAVASHPVNTAIQNPPGVVDPYLFTRDGLNSGQ